MKVLADASFLIALANPREAPHQACAQIARQLVGAIVVPITSIPEATHMLYRRRGHHVMRAFVREMAKPIWQIEPFVAEDLLRINELLVQYQDAEIDFTDCAIVTLAERIHCNTILTLDARDFRMIRPKHIPHFTILPE